MDRITLSLGSGGEAMRDFLKSVIIKHLGNPYLNRLFDSARFTLKGDAGMTTDSFVIKPIFFPGGDIGKLAVAGTVNDLVVTGLKPRYLSLGLILEEGFAVADLERILSSLRKTADHAGVLVVTGDTKVVKKGEADGIFINTAGVGEAAGKPVKVKEGDAIIVTGTVGDHAAAVMVARREFEFEGNVKSDCMPLHDLLPLWKSGAKWMRDVTRGGLATMVCELAEGEGVPVLVEEAKIPLSPPVRAISEILGLDPLYLASEGKAIIVAEPAKADRILKSLKKMKIGKSAAIIGRVCPPGRKGEAILKSISGGLRRLEPLTGELLPRIC